MLEETLVITAGFMIVGLAAVYAWSTAAVERMKQESLNYREELRSGRANKPQGDDWMGQLAAYAMSEPGQQLISAVLTKMKAGKE